MTRARFMELHRQARNGNLGPLCMATDRATYQWLLHEVYDLRFPHIGDQRHLKRRTFDSLGSWRPLREKLWQAAFDTRVRRHVSERGLA